MNIVLLLGKKLLPDGSMDGEFVDRCECAARAFSVISKSAHSESTTLVISGGMTVKGAVSEAQAAVSYLAEHHPEVVGHILLEERARTTPENILFTQELLKEQDITPTRLTIVGRTSQERKVRVLVRRVWRLGNPWNTYIPSLDTSPWYVRLFERTGMVALSYLDPYGTSLLMRLLRWCCRNG